MTRRAGKGLLVYAVLILLLASGRAWQIHSAPFDCADEAGHGPDPETKECERSIAHMRERRPEDTLHGFIAIVISGALGLGAYGAVRLALRSGYLRRFADGDRPT